MDRYGGAGGRRVSSRKVRGRSGGGGRGGRDLEGLDHSRGRRLRSAGLVEPIGRRAERFPPILGHPPPNSLSAFSLTTSGDPAHAWLCPPKAAVDPLRLLAGSSEDSHVALLTQFLRCVMLTFPTLSKSPIAAALIVVGVLLASCLAIKNLKSKNRLRFAPSLPFLVVFAAFRVQKKNTPTHSGIIEVTLYTKYSVHEVHLPSIFKISQPKNKKPKNQVAGTWASRGGADRVRSIERAER